MAVSALQTPDVEAATNAAVPAFAPKAPAAAPVSQPEHSSQSEAASKPERAEASPSDKKELVRRDVEKGDTVWQYWKEDKAGREWAKYRSDFVAKNPHALMERDHLRAGTKVELPRAEVAQPAASAPAGSPPASPPPALPSPALPAPDVRSLIDDARRRAQTQPPSIPLAPAPSAPAAPPAQVPPVPVPPPAAPKSAVPAVPQSATPAVTAPTSPAAPAMVPPPVPAPPAPVSPATPASAVPSPAAVTEPEAQPKKEGGLADAALSLIPGYDLAMAVKNYKGAVVD